MNDMVCTGRRSRLPLVFVGVLLALSVSSMMAAAEETTQGQAEQIASPAITPAAQGQLVYLDKDGNRVTPPPGAVTAPMTPSVNRSSEGLVQVQSSVPGGGVMVDLKGRFRNYVVATKKPDGAIAITCTQEGGAPAASTPCAEPEPKREEAAAPVKKEEAAKVETAASNQDGKE